MMQQSLTARWPSIKNWLIILLLVLMIGRFATQVYARMLTNSNAALGDQSALLQLGLDLREHGMLTDGTRNPLYPAFLALFAQREWTYFTSAKLLSALFGVLAILALFGVGKKLFGTLEGLLAAYLLSINVEFIVHSASVLVESLLTLLFVLTFFAMVRALQPDARLRWWVLAGVLAGLAYLTKGTGQLLAGSFVLIVALFYRGQIIRSRKIWLFVLSYSAVASPLWVFNTIHFGNPTFNYAITHQMWMDNWKEWHIDNVENLPTLTSYLQSHTPAEIGARLWGGVKAMRNILLKTLYPTRTLKVDRFLLSPISGYAFALLALLVLFFWRRLKPFVSRHTPEVSLTLLPAAIFFLLFAWYSAIVSLGQRFLLPLIPLIFLLVAALIVWWGNRLAARGEWWARILLALALIAFVFQVRWAVRTTVQPMQSLLTQNVFAQDRVFNEDAAVPLRWLAEQSPEKTTVAWGPSGNTLPTWAFSDQLNFLRYPPDVSSLTNLTKNLTARGAQYIIITPDMYSRYKNVLETAFPTNGSQVEIASLPDGWALTFAHRAIPCEACVFRLLENFPPTQATNFRLGENILLTGFDVFPTNLYPGDTLFLTLHWATEAAVRQDLTVFTQLLGPNLQLYGQMDHQPINNLMPTSRWQAGYHFADRYDIVIDPNAPPGDYLVLVGMYNFQTGERVPVVQSGEPVADNAIRLTTVHILQRVQ